MTSSARRNTLRRTRVRAVAIATAGASVLALFATLQAPSATAADDDGTTAQAASEWTPQSYDETSVAAREAKETGQRVELESQRGANTTAFVNPDGTTTVEITQGDTRVEQDGQFVDVSPSLEKDGGVLVPEAAQADIEISDGSGTEPLATVNQGSNSLSLDWNSDLPAARVDDAEATFDAGADRDVRVTATNTGFNVNVVLDRVPTSAPVYRLPVTAKGVRLVATTGGGFAANDAAGKTVFRIAPPLMWDSSQPHPEAGPDTVPVEARVIDAADGGQVLELRTDYAWMSDPARVLPIFVDPDVYVDTLGQQNSGYVSSLTPTTAYPTASMNRVGYSTAYGKTRTYWQPNLPARVSGRVVSATLRLYEWDSASCTKTPVTIYPIGSYWDPSTATWNNRPVSLTSSPLRMTTQPFAHGVDGQCGNAFETIEKDPAKTGDAAFALKNLVDAWMNYIPDDPFTPANEQVGLPYYGMTLMGSDTDPATYKGFCSYTVNPSGTSCFQANPVRQPTLTITYNTPPTKAFNTQQSPVTCYDGDAPRVTSLVPTLKATADDVDVWHRNAGEYSPTDDGQENVHLKFEVWPQRAVEIADLNNQDPNDPEGPVVMTVSGYSPYVQRNTATQWDVPSGKLVQGNEYVWRAIADDGTDTSPYWSDWMLFRVNTAETPGNNCPPRVLDETTAGAAAMELQGLVDGSTTRYYDAYVDFGTGVVTVTAARVTGQADAVTAAQAKDAAMGALAASTKLTPEQIAAASAALATPVVPYSKAALLDVETSLAARQDANEPALSSIVSVAQDHVANVVVIGATNPTPELVAAMNTSYGARAVVEADQSFPGEGLAGPLSPFNDQPSYFGGLAIRPYSAAGSRLGPCTSAFPMRRNGDPNHTYLLTAGHCFGYGGGNAAGSTARISNCQQNVDGQYLGTVVNRTYGGSMDAAIIDAASNYVYRMWTGEGYDPNKPETQSCKTVLPRENYETLAGFVSRRVGEVFDGAPERGRGAVCKWGATTGFHCKYKVRDIASNGKVSTTYDLASGTAPGADHGDSGGPVFGIIQTGPRAGQIRAMGLLVEPYGQQYAGQSGGFEGMKYWPISIVNQKLGVYPVIAPTNGN